MNSKKYGKYRFKKFLSAFSTYFFSFLLVLFCAFPFYWMISSSLKNSVEFFAVPPTFFPKSITLEQYVKLFKETFFTTWFRNTVLVTVISTILSVFVATLGAYSLTRGRFRAKEAIANTVFNDISSLFFMDVTSIFPNHTLRA